MSESLTVVPTTDATVEIVMSKYSSFIILNFLQKRIFFSHKICSAKQVFLIKNCSQPDEIPSSSLWGDDIPSKTYACKN